MPEITSLSEAKEASKAVFATSEWKWIDDKMTEEVKGYREFEGELPDRMRRSLISTIVDQGFERGRNRTNYYYYLYSDTEEIKITVEPKTGNVKVFAEHCPEDL